MTSSDMRSAPSLSCLHLIQSTGLYFKKYLLQRKRLASLSKLHSQGKLRMAGISIAFLSSDTKKLTPQVLLFCFCWCYLFESLYDNTGGALPFARPQGLFTPSASFSRRSWMEFHTSLTLNKLVELLL
ncbi:UNVERIFIED_CONTAM: hypothetical protein K2H54_048377 [Gekko kuhli]